MTESSPESSQCIPIPKRENRLTQMNIYLRISYSLTKTAQRGIAKGSNLFLMSLYPPFPLTTYPRSPPNFFIFPCLEYIFSKSFKFFRSSLNMYVGVGGVGK